MPFSTEGLLLEGAFRAQLEGVQRVPRTCSAQTQDLLTTCPALVARTGTRQAWGTILKLSCSVGAGGPFRPVTRALLRPDKRHQLPATESKCA